MRYFLLGCVALILSTGAVFSAAKKTEDEEIVARAALAVAYPVVGIRNDVHESQLAFYLRAHPPRATDSDYKEPKYVSAVLQFTIAGVSFREVLKTKPNGKWQRVVIPIGAKQDGKKGKMPYLAVHDLSVLVADRAVYDFNDFRIVFGRNQKDDDANVQFENGGMDTPFDDFIARWERVQKRGLVITRRENDDKRRRRGDAPDYYVEVDASGLVPPGETAASDNVWEPLGLDGFFERDPDYKSIRSSWGMIEGMYVVASSGDLSPEGAALASVFFTPRASDTLAEGRTFFDTRITVDANTLAEMHAALGRAPSAEELERAKKYLAYHNRELDARIAEIRRKLGDTVASARALHARVIGTYAGEKRMDDLGAAIGKFLATRFLTADIETGVFGFEALKRAVHKGWPVIFRDGGGRIFVAVGYVPISGGSGGVRGKELGFGGSGAAIGVSPELLERFTRKSEKDSAGDGESEAEGSRGAERPALPEWTAQIENFAHPCVRPVLWSEVTALVVRDIRPDRETMKGVLLGVTPVPEQ